MKAIIVWTLIAVFPGGKTATSPVPFKSKQECLIVVKEFEQFKSKIIYQCEPKCIGDEDACKKPPVKKSL